MKPFLGRKDALNNLFKGKGNEEVVKRVKKEEWERKEVVEREWK